MSQHIDILAFIGSNSDARNARGFELDTLLKSAGFEEGLGATLLNGDRQWLEDTLGVNPTLCCLVHAPEEEEAPLEEQEPGEGEKEDDGDEESEDSLGGRGNG
jgi:hypothetical protein